MPYDGLEEVPHELLPVSLPVPGAKVPAGAELPKGRAHGSREPPRRAIRSRGRALWPGALAQGSRGPRRRIRRAATRCHVEERLPEHHRWRARGRAPRGFSQLAAFLKGDPLVAAPHIEATVALPEIPR